MYGLVRSIVVAISNTRVGSDEMSMHANPILLQSGHRTSLWRVLCLFGLCLLLFPTFVQAQKHKKNNRPTEKVYIDHADILWHDQSVRPDIQVARGRVRFRYNGMTLRCDSAWLSQERSFFTAFGHVRVTRPDGVSLNCHRLHYEGLGQMLQARGQVVLREPGRQLRCDSLDYSMLSHDGTFFGGRGTLVIGPNTIIADEGHYNTKTKDFRFTGNVVMRAVQGRIRSVHTPSADGNMETGDVHVVGKSTLRMSDGGVIHTSEGYFNQISGSARTVGPATITSPERDITGKNIAFNNETGDAEGHDGVTINDKKARRIIKGKDVWYNSHSGYMEGRVNVDIEDKQNNRTIRGQHVVYNASTGKMENYGSAFVDDRSSQRVIKGDTLIYNEKTRMGEAHGRVDYLDRKNKNAFRAEDCFYTDEAALAYGGTPGPLALDFSQRDTLYVHADTVRMRAWNVNTDSVYREVYGVDNVRAYRTDIQAVCGLLVANTLDSCVTLYDNPVLWSGERQIMGDSIRAFMNDSTVRDAFVMGDAFSIERMPDKEHFNQISAKSMHAHFIEGVVRQTTAIDNVLAIFHPTDDKDSTLTGMVYVETDTMRMYLSPQRKMEKIWMPKTEGTMYPMNQIPAERRQLRGFAWLENLRPRDKDDVFRRVNKADSQRRQYRKMAAPPRQRIADTLTSTTRQP